MQTQTEPTEARTWQPASNPVTYDAASGRLTISFECYIPRGPSRVPPENRVAVMMLLDAIRAELHADPAIAEHLNRCLDERMIRLGDGSDTQAQYDMNEARQQKARTRAAAEGR